MKFASFCRKYPWARDAARLRLGLLHRPVADVPHLDRKHYGAELDILDAFAAWVMWEAHGKTGFLRPVFDARPPRLAWDVLGEWLKAHPRPTPAPGPQPAPPGPTVDPSLELDRPLVFTAWAPGDVARDERWHTAVIEVPGVAPLWRIEGTEKWIAQAETESQIDTALFLLAGVQGEKAIVATQGGWTHANADGTYTSVVHRFLDAGVNVALVEAYQNDGGPTPDRIVWQALHDGFPAGCVYPVAGVYHGYPLADYDLAAYGRREAVWLGETMQAADWDRWRQIAG